MGLDTIFAYKTNIILTLLPYTEGLGTTFAYKTPVVLTLLLYTQGSGHDFPLYNPCDVDTLAVYTGV